MEIDMDSILKIVILLLTIGGAFLTRHSILSKKDLKKAEEIAEKLASSVDKLKFDEPEAAKFLIGDILKRFADNKEVLDEFLKKMELNPPHKTDDG